MIFEIDKSCQQVLRENDDDCIAVFEQLALDRRKCKNYIASDRETFLRFAKYIGFSGPVRHVYLRLYNISSEQRLLIGSVNTYVRIVADGDSVSFQNEGEKKVIILPVRCCIGKDYTDLVYLLTENEDDSSFYIN